MEITVLDIQILKALHREVKGSFQSNCGNDRALQGIATGNEMARPTGSLPIAQHQQKNVADV